MAARGFPPPYDPYAEERARGCGIILLGTAALYAAVFMLLLRRHRRRKLAKGTPP